MVHHEKNSRWKLFSIVLYITIVVYYKDICWMTGWYYSFSTNTLQSLLYWIFLFKQISCLHYIMFALETLHEQDSFLFLYAYCDWVLFISKKNDWFIFQHFMKHQWSVNVAFFMNFYPLTHNIFKPHKGISHGIFFCSMTDQLLSFLNIVLK